MTEKGAHASSNVLPRMFVVLFAQLLCLIAISFLLQNDPTFVPHSAFALDYHDFYLAAGDWVRKINPYLRGRLYTPPSSIIVGLVLYWLPFEVAGFIFFIVNISLVVLSLQAFSKQIGLTRQNEVALIGVMTVFYPFYFLVQRGNLDGVMLALLVFGFRATSTIARGGLVGFSLATKLYSGLLLPIMLLKRQWKIAVVAIVTAALTQLPFLRLVPKFFGAVASRSAQTRIDQNISPAAAISSWVLSSNSWKLGFALFWAGTLLLKFLRDRDSEMSINWPAYVPWMISFPALVYPYSGVLALCPLALIASACQYRKITRAEVIVVIGFGLLGFQAVAWTSYLAPVLSVPTLVHIIPAIGTLLMLLGACGLPEYDSVAIRER